MTFASVSLDLRLSSIVDERHVTGMARTGQNLVTCGYDSRLIWWTYAEVGQAREGENQ